MPCNAAINSVSIPVCLGSFKEVTSGDSLSLSDLISQTKDLRVRILAGEEKQVGTLHQFGDDKSIVLMNQIPQNPVRAVGERFSKKTVELAKFILKSTAWLKALGVKSPAVGAARGIALDSMRIFAIAALLDRTLAAKDSLVKAWNAKEEVPGFRTRMQLKAVEDSSTFFNLFGLSSLTVLGFFPTCHSLLGRVQLATDIADVVGDGAGLTMSCQDYHRATQELKEAKKNDFHEDVQKAFQEKARLSMLKIAKQVCSIAGFIFGMALLVMGAPMVPVIAALTVSLAGTIFSLTSYVYEKGMSFEEVNFFEAKKVKLA